MAGYLLCLMPFQGTECADDRYRFREKSLTKNFIFQEEI